MTDQSIGDALQEQWRTSARDAAFGRAARKLLLAAIAKDPRVPIVSYMQGNPGEAAKFFRALVIAHDDIYPEDKNNG